MKRESGQVGKMIPELPPQLYTVACTCKPLGNREGRCFATIRKPGDLPLTIIPKTGRGVLKENSLLECHSTLSGFAMVCSLAVLFSFGSAR